MEHENRMYIWIPKKQLQPDGELSITVPYPLGVLPAYGWSLVLDTDPNSYREVGDILGSNISAHRELLDDDMVVDLDKKSLKFKSRTSPGGHWLVLEL